MAKEDVVTGIDGLLNYLATKGELDIASLSAALGVSEATIHEWSTVLEKAKLVTITYKLGKMYVALVQESIKMSETTQGPRSVQQGDINANAMPTTTGAQGVHYEKMTVEEIDRLNAVKSSILSDSITVQEHAVERIDPQIRELRTYITEAQAVFRGKSGELKSSVAELNALKTQAGGALESVGTYKKSLETLTSEMLKGTGAAHGEQNMTANLDEVSKNTRALIEDIRGKSAFINTSTDELLKQYDAKVIEERRKIVAFSDSVKKESKRLESFAQASESQLATYQSQADEYRKEFERYMAHASKERQVFIDHSAKAQHTLENLYNLTQKKFNNFDALLSNQATELGKVAELERRLGAIKTAVDEITAERDNIKKELKEFEDTLDSLQKDRKKSASDKNKTITDIDKKSRTYEDRVKSLKTKITKTGEDVTDVEWLAKPKKQEQ